ncbi:hypothetical protein ACSLOE_31020, partial [Escherichia coli]|uniref:hypothetical protein n=1 Tax=Escherichia coli TaxID=562 RepID=UPI003EDEBBA0
MGVWGSPQTVSGCAQGAAGTVAARSFWGSGSKNTQGILRRQKHDRAVERGEREIGQNHG